MFGGISIMASLRGTKQSHIIYRMTDCFVPRNDAMMETIALLRAHIFTVISALWLFKNSLPLAMTGLRRAARHCEARSNPTTRAYMPHQHILARYWLVQFIKNTIYPQVHTHCYLSIVTIIKNSLPLAMTL